jgi:hypothetical protein
MLDPIRLLLKNQYAAASSHLRLGKQYAVTAQDAEAILVQLERISAVMGGKV